MGTTRKDIDVAEAETNQPGSRLRSELSVLELTAIGLAVVVGAGIFATAPRVFSDLAGPAVVWSFAIAAALCVPVALCYAECASRVAVAGSAYTFARVTFGRSASWLLGWLLVLEYVVGAAVVAKGWSVYLSAFLQQLGVTLPDTPVDWGAVLIVVLLSLFLSAGVRATSRFTIVATGAKLLALVLTILVGAAACDVAPTTPLTLVPAAPAVVGVAPQVVDLLGGTVTGAAVLFYAFIGFDSVSTMAEEARFPRRDLPRAILATLGIATVLYLCVAVAMAGMSSARELATDDDRTPLTLASVFGADGGGVVSSVVTVGALAGLTTGILVLMLGQSRIALAMTRDGLLPAGFAQMGWRRNPHRLVLATGFCTAVVGGVGSVEALQPVVNLGTLVAFGMVCASAWVLGSGRIPGPKSRFPVPVLRVAAVSGVVASFGLAVVVVAQADIDNVLWLAGSAAVYATAGAVVHTLRRRSEEFSPGRHRSPRAPAAAHDGGTWPMFRWRIRPHSPPNDLPAIRRLGWAAAVVVTAALLLGWVRQRPDGLIGPPTTDTPWQALRILLVFAVPVALVVFLVYAFWRLQLERLAHRPGPVLVLPFGDRTGQRRTVLDRPASDDLPTVDSALAIELTSMFQQYVVRCRLYGPTAIPPSGRSTDFLTVIERAGDAASGVWGAIGRLPRLLFPVSAYQVSCTILPPDPTGPGRASDGRLALLVELTRFPKSMVAPVIVRDESWERVVERAAHWVAGVILPRTRQCRYPPWTLWRRLRLPDDLFDHYQRFQQHSRNRELDAAMAALRSALLLDPGNLALRLELGKMQEQLGSHLDALATYDDLVGRASRGHRGLALLWNPPPAPRGADADRADGDDPAWSDARRISELPAGHPVVYVARYRHMLLLGLGDRLAQQWWPETCRPGAPEHDGVPLAERCGTAEHRPAHERRSDYSRRILVQRLRTRYPWIADELRSRRLLATPAERFFDELGDDRPRDDGSGATLATDLRVFLTTASVCELELLLSERGTGLLTAPAVWKVVSRRSLRLVLPWSVLRAGLAIETANRGRPEDERVAPSEAGHSIVHQLTRPHILAKHGSGLLPDEASDTRLPDLAVLRSYVARTLRSPVRTLHSWHEHYNAACVFALALLWPRAEADRAEFDHEASDAAVAQLYKAVACGDSGFLASQREWLLTEDPDLDILCGTDAFFDLEAATFGSVRSTGRRGPNMVTWQVRTFTTSVVLDVARQMCALWDARVAGPPPPPPWPELATWLALEDATWEILENLCREHRDSEARHAAVQELHLRCAPHLTVPDQRHPRFTDGVLARQYGSLREDLVRTGPADREGTERQVDEVIRRSAVRFEATVTALRAAGPADACCRRGRHLVTDGETARLRSVFDPARHPRRAGPGDPTGPANAQLLDDWIWRSRERWAALVDLFDDGRPHGRSFADRRSHLRDLFRDTARPTAVVGTVSTNGR